MSWYNKNYTQRVPVAVDNTAGVGATVDVTITIPPEFEQYWAVVQSSGYDIRVCGPDGITPITFQRSSWTYADRLGVIQVHNLTISAGCMAQLWIYWGYASATNAAGSFVAASPLTGSILPVRPGTPQVVARPERPGDAQPAHRIVKGSGERLRIFWDLRPLLLLHTIPYNERLAYEELKEIITVDVQQAGASVATMVDATLTRLLDGWIVTWVKAGTTGNTYTAIVTVDTTLGRRLEARALVYVQDLKET